MNERDDRNDDRLWDPRADAAPGDAELRALEQLLRPFAHDGRPLRELPLPTSPFASAPGAEPGRRAPWPSWLALAAALLASAMLAWWPRESMLAPGAAPRTIATAASARELRLGELVSVTVQPDSVLRFIKWAPGEQLRLALDRGSVSVRVQPPPAVAPRFVVLETPRGNVVDLGCRYEATLRDDGRVAVRVTEGAVEFAFPQQLVFVPAGAATVVDPIAGPSTPRFVDASPELRKAIDAYDAARRDLDLDVRGRTLKLVLAACQSERDSLVLWHLLFDPEPTFREVAEAELLQREGSPVASKDSHFDAAVWLAFLRRKWAGG